MSGVPINQQFLKCFTTVTGSTDNLHCILCNNDNTIKQRVVKMNCCDGICHFSCVNIHLFLRKKCPKCCILLNKN